MTPDRVRKAYPPPRRADRAVPGGILARVSADRASLARNCPVVEAAVGLSERLGDDGRAVTAGGSLRPADVPDAARALGVRVTARVRRAADVPQVHRQWIAAAGMGLIVVDGTRARRSETMDDPLRAWWAGLQAVLAEEVTTRLDTDPAPLRWRP